MKIQILFFILIFFCFSCTPQYQKDMFDNQYLEITNHEDPSASYLGEWTGATGPALTAIKINEIGHIKICSSNQHFGSLNGKVFKNDGKIKMIFESGSQYEILSTHLDHILVSSYGKEYKYYSGKVPEVCKNIFANF